MKKVIITGVTGQDGSFMADYLLQNTDHTIVAGVRRLSVANHENINHLKNHPRFKLIDLDVSDSQNVEDVIRTEKPDYFINFAANSFVGSSWRMPVNHMNTNCMADIIMLALLKNLVM
jgi:GDPmannose 4,6-dehydratase